MTLSKNNKAALMIAGQGRIFTEMENLGMFDVDTLVDLLDIDDRNGRDELIRCIVADCPDAWLVKQLSWNVR